MGKVLQLIACCSIYSFALLLNDYIRKPVANKYNCLMKWKHLYTFSYCLHTDMASVGRICCTWSHSALRIFVSLIGLQQLCGFTASFPATLRMQSVWCCQYDIALVQRSKDSFIVKYCFDTKFQWYLASDLTCVCCLL